MQDFKFKVVTHRDTQFIETVAGRNLQSAQSRIVRAYLENDQFVKSIKEIK